jgi:hypothetical protein
MQFVKSGRIIEYQYLRIADEAPVRKPAVLVSGARFLADPDTFGQQERPAWWPKWPVAARALSRSHRDRRAGIPGSAAGYGRPYPAQRYGWAGARDRQVLRDQFCCCRPADTFGVTEAPMPSRLRTAFGDDMFYQPTGDGRSAMLRRRLGRAPSAVPLTLACDMGV